MKKIIILSGDPNSINSEIIIKSWKRLSVATKKKIYFISNNELLKKQFKKLKYSIKTKVVHDFKEEVKGNYLKIINLKLKFANPFKVKKKVASKFIIESLNLSHKIASENRDVGLINCSIDKKLLNKKKIGVTEFLASKCKIKNNSEVMLIGNNKLYVAPLTTHIDVKEVSKKINKKLIFNKIMTIQSWFTNKYKRRPKFGILGLNPHNAELRSDSEERKVIIPSINLLKKRGINIQGPLISDTLFMKEYLKYDVIVGMYHDQIITPFKTIFKFNAMNITLGLNYLRVSPDHGTAKNLIGKNKATAESLISCINFISKSKK